MFGFSAFHINLYRGNIFIRKLFERSVFNVFLGTKFLSQNDSALVSIAQKFKLVLVLENNGIASTSASASTISITIVVTIATATASASASASAIASASTRASVSASASSSASVNYSNALCKNLIFVDVNYKIALFWVIKIRDRMTRCERTVETITFASFCAANIINSFGNSNALCVSH